MNTTLLSNYIPVKINLKKEMCLWLIQQKETSVYLLGFILYFSLSSDIFQYLIMTCHFTPGIGVMLGYVSKTQLSIISFAITI